MRELKQIYEIELFNKNTKEEVKIGTRFNYSLLSIDGIGLDHVDISLNNNARFDGAINTSRRIRHRNINMTIEYTGNNQLEARKNIIRFFNSHHNGVFNIRYGNDRYKIDYIVEQFNPIMENVNLPFKFTVSLICPNPFFSDGTDGLNSMVTWTNALVFPIVIPKGRGMIFGRRKVNTFTNIVNQGHIESGIVVTFKANSKVVNPYIINTDTRETIKIEKEMNSGEIFIIDTNAGNKGVEYLNGKEELNGYQYLSRDSTFIQLNLGDNMFRYGADSGIEHIEIIIQSKNLYLGV